MKGRLCSISGSHYEKMVHGIVKRCKINNKPFNTQKPSELAGSSNKNDITCVYNKNDIPIEIKKFNTPDWMQCTLYNQNNNLGNWEAVDGKINKQCREIFNDFLKGKILYNGEIPPFMVNPITHQQWKETKSKTNQWDDVYIDVPSDTIQRLYQLKGCKYIQISEYGLYHLGEDTCGFDVPIFEIEQHLRIRTKIHTSSDKSGFCKMSITAACKPKNMKNLARSKYSLDDPLKIPPPLKFTNG